MCRTNMIEDLVYKDRGQEIEASLIDWKPLTSIMNSNKSNITLNFNSSIGKFKPFTPNITDSKSHYFNDQNLKI